jgi:hypothetical protein
VTTPIRLALLPSSALRTRVSDGLGALSKAHRQLIDKPLRSSFADSLEVDEALRKTAAREPQWDYLLGHDPSSVVVGLEPHSAHTGEVAAVIGKKAAARRQLQSHLKKNSRIAGWFWVALGKVDFAPPDKVIRRLEQEGITFVGGSLREKDLRPLMTSKGSRR